MMEAARTSEPSADNHFTRQYNPEDNSEHHTRRCENLKSHVSEMLTVSIIDLMMDAVTTSKTSINFYQCT
jgi:hypothetical protein